MEVVPAVEGESLVAETQLTVRDACNSYTHVHVHVHGQLIFSRKSDCLGCAVLLCLVCLFDFACFFLSSFSSLI